MKIKFILLGIVILAMSACAPSPPIPSNELVDYVPGFFSGALHGLIFPLTMIGSIFSDDVGVYSAYNTGWFYDFGFFIGVAAFFRAI